MTAAAATVRLLWVMMMNWESLMNFRSRSVNRPMFD